MISLAGYWLRDKLSKSIKLNYTSIIIFLKTILVNKHLTNVWHSKSFFCFFPMQLCLNQLSETLPFHWLFVLIDRCCGQCVGEAETGASDSEETEASGPGEDELQPPEHRIGGLPVRSDSRCHPQLLKCTCAQIHVLIFIFCVLTGSWFQIPALPYRRSCPPPNQLS